MESPLTRSSATEAPHSGSCRDAVEPLRELQIATRREFVRLAPILALLGGLSVAVAAWRASRFGWAPLTIAHVVFLSGLVAVVRWQDRLPVKWIAALLGAIGIVGGTLSLLQYGFASSGLLLLLAAVVLLGVFVGVRAALLVCGFITLTVALIAGMTCSGLWPVNVDLATYATSPEGWAVQLVHVVFLASLLSALMNGVQARLKASISDLEQRTDELAATNASLKAEVEARARVEDELRQREARYRMLTHHLKEVLIQHDTDFRIVYVSPSVERMFGYSVEEAMQLGAEQLMTSDSLRLVMEQYRRLWSREQSSYAAELVDVEYVRKDGTTFWGEVAAERLTSEAGELTGAVVVVRDITERRRIRLEQERIAERLRQTERMQVLGRLAGGIAHDFNNQLAGILGYAELLKNQCRDNERAAEAVQVILDCGQRSRELTAKLLTFARQEPEKALTVDMHAIVREVVAILARSVGKNVELAIELDTAPALVTGDPSQLQNTLLNLAVNARDAMPDGGTLTIASSAVPGRDAVEAGASELDAGKMYLLVEVRDTGVGIPECALPHVFEPFYTTKAAGYGTGIGLSAVQGTALAHHGAITVRSQLGEGSTFGLYLPLAAVPQPTLDATMAKWTSGTGRILVVDDEPNMRSVLQLSLSELGYAVDVAADGEEAVARFRSNPMYDLVLLDMVMPGMNGVATFHALRSVAPDTRVILMSGYSEDGAAWDLIRAGALKLITKPFMLAELSADVATAVASRNPVGAQTPSRPVH